jgi:hypothetical protein
MEMTVLEIPEAVSLTSNVPEITRSLDSEFRQPAAFGMKMDTSQDHAMYCMKNDAQRCSGVESQVIFPIIAR